MKKTLISSLLAGAALLPLAASAQVTPGADGSITFNGNVQSSTCIISVNNGSKDGTVNLPTAKTSELDGATKTTGERTFSIALTGCTLPTQTVKPFFASNAAATDGRLLNTLGDSGAKNVELELLTAAGVFINLKDDSTKQAAQQVVLVNGAGSLDYKVRYYATGAATTGLVRSNTMFYLNFP